MSACTPLVGEARPYVSKALKKLEAAYGAVTKAEMEKQLALAEAHIVEARRELQVRSLS
jgi:hypothetical protein